MHVVGIAVVGGAQRHHRLQRRRAAGGDLQAVETAPGNAHHADAAGAPGLRRQPRDHLQRVVLLLLQILVEHQPIGIPSAAHVHAHAGIAVPGQVRMRQIVALGGPVAAAIRQVFQDRRHRLAILRPPDAGGKARAIRKGDPNRIVHRNAAGKVCDGAHEVASGCRTNLTGRRTARQTVVLPRAMAVRRASSHRCHFLRIYPCNSDSRCTLRWGRVSKSAGHRRKFRSGLIRVPDCQRSKSRRSPRTTRN